jgi:hypothetical protein
MSAVDEQDLSRRLSGVLDAITPSPAPVGAALRNGKFIRFRRNITITAGLAITAGFVVAAPGLLHQPDRPAVSRVRPVVKVMHLCPAVPHSGRAPALQSDMAVRAGGLPTAELAVGRCAWLTP